jgi:hypothetical protein
MKDAPAVGLVVKVSVKHRTLPSVVGQNFAGLAATVEPQDDDEVAHDLDNPSIVTALEGNPLAALVTTANLGRDADAGVEDDLGLELHRSLLCSTFPIMTGMLVLVKRHQDFFCEKKTLDTTYGHAIMVER